MHHWVSLLAHKTGFNHEVLLFHSNDCEVLLSFNTCHIRDRSWVPFHSLFSWKFSKFYPNSTHTPHIKDILADFIVETEESRYRHTSTSRTNQVDFSRPKVTDAREHPGHLLARLAKRHAHVSLGFVVSIWPHSPVVTYLV